MAAEARRLVVGRLRKPHGLKGDCAIFPLTDDPAAVFAPGRSLDVVDLEGAAVSGPLEVLRARPYHREWLVAFRGRPDRTAVEPLAGMFVTVPAAERPAPVGDEAYLDELQGFSVRAVDGRVLGLVSGWYELPGGLTLEVQGPKREFLVPYKQALVREVDREGRRMVVDLPDGLTELD